MKRLLPILTCCALAAASPSQRAAADRDRDGLSDFHEMHKYGTDPAKRDSDGDGKPDGDWHERREYAYTIRALLQVMPSYDVASFNDDYQDARVLDECEHYVEIEVVYYPFNTCQRDIEGVVGWRRANARDRKLKPFLEPGVTTNWDAEMRRDLLARLRDAGIELDALTDKEVVERVAKWALRHAPGTDKTCAWTVYFPDGEPAVHPDLARKFESQKRDPELTVEQQLARDVYGKGMYYSRMRGSCTPSAVYLATVLRAIGIPTRVVLTIPVIDASDPHNVELAKRRLTHHRARHAIVSMAAKLGSSFAAHTYNEVWVGVRWRRLNYDRLGQNILDARCMGLMTHVHTFRDLSEAGLATGWGLKDVRHNPAFAHRNPYTCLGLSDRFGVHAKVENPPVSEDGVHTALTITRAYWFESADRPAMIGADWHGAQERGAGHVLVHVAEAFPGDGAGQYAEFFRGVDKAFVLRAPGQRPVSATCWQCWWVDPDAGVAEFYVRIEPDAFARMKRGVAYALEARNGSAARRWKVEPGIALTRR